MQSLTYILKAIIATFFFIVSMELSGTWVLFFEEREIYKYHQSYLFIQGAIQFLLILAFTYFINRKEPGKIWLHTKFKWYIIAALLGCSFILIQTPLKWIYNQLFETEYWINYDLDGLPSLKKINTLSTILLIPIAEELFFRRYIQQELQEKLKWWLAILTSSLLFALHHAPYLNLIISGMNHDWHLCYLTFFGGLISGCIYYKSKSIGPSIVFHIFWNLMAVVM